MKRESTPEELRAQAEAEERRLKAYDPDNWNDRPRPTSAEGALQAVGDAVKLVEKRPHGSWALAQKEWEFIQARLAAKAIAAETKARQSDLERLRPELAALPPPPPDVLDAIHRVNSAFDSVTPPSQDDAPSKSRYDLYIFEGRDSQAKYGYDTPIETLEREALVIHRDPVEVEREPRHLRVKVKMSRNPVSPIEGTVCYNFNDYGAIMVRTDLEHAEPLPVVPTTPSEHLAANMARQREEAAPKPEFKIGDFV